MEKLEFTSTIKGRIVKVLESRGGTSAKTGNAWKVQSFVIEEVGTRFPQKMVFEIFGEDNISKFDVQEGKEYEVSVTFSADEYQDRYYQRIRAWNVTPLDVPKESFAVPASPDNIAPTQEENADPFGPADDDELPFG